MAVTYSDATQIAALNAATAATNGNKSLAYLTAWRDAIGTNPLITIRREGSIVWSGGFTGTLTISGSTLTIPANLTQEFIVAADIDTGTWTYTIANRTNLSVYITVGLTKTGGGGEMILSGDLLADGSLTTQAVIITSPPLDTGGGGGGSGGAFPTVTDSRMFAWVDPAIPWAQTPQQRGANASTYPYMQVNNVWVNPRPITEFPEPGVLAQSRDPGNPAPAGEYTIARVTHPTNAAKLAHLHRIDSRYLDWRGTERSQYLCYAVTDEITYWVAFSIRMESDFTIDPTNASVGLGITIFDLHESGGGYNRSPIELMWSTTSDSLTFRIFGQYTVGAGKKQTDLWTSETISLPSAWQHFVVRFKVGRFLSSGAFVQAWRAIGSGSLTQIVNKTATSADPFGYVGMDENACFLKLGAYRWDLDTRKTLYATGMYAFRDEPGTPTIDANAMHALLMSKQ